MENFSYYIPFYVASGGVATSGHSSDLVGPEVGLFDRQTWSVATPIGNGKEFFFAQGAIGGLDYYGNVSTTSHKSPFFYGKDIEEIFISKPQRIRNEEWVIGFNGSPSSVGLKYVTGESTRFLVYFHGNPTYRFFAAPKQYVISYTPKEPCVTPCDADDCPDGIVDCLTHTQTWVDQINTHTELRKFGVQARIVTNTYVAATATMIKWCLSLCDNGTPTDLLAVQAQAPVGSDVIRLSRDNANSVYQFCRFDDEVAIPSFQQSNSVLNAVCATCPSGSFLIPSLDVYIIRRPIVGGEDFSTAASRDTYANVIWSAYATQESITTSTTTTSTTTAAGTFNANATFVGRDDSVAIVKVKFVEGTVLDPAIGTDIIEFSHNEAAVCVFATPAAVAWTNCGTGIRSSRTLKIKNLNRPDCNVSGNRLADLTTVLAGVVGIQIGTLAVVAGTACKDDYTVSQFSVDCLDEACLSSNVTFTFDDLPAFENEAWEVVPPTVEEDDTRKCGIRITAGYLDKQFDNCSFEPQDYYETQPVKMEISLLGEDWDHCDFASRPTVSQSQIGQISRQSGEWVIREVVMKTDAYQKHMDQYSNDPRTRQAFNQNLLNMVDRKAYYDLYHIRYKASYARSARKNEQEKFTTVFAFKEGDSRALTFKTQVIDLLTAKSGVVPSLFPGDVGGLSGQQT